MFVLNIRKLKALSDKAHIIYGFITALTYPSISFVIMICLYLIYQILDYVTYELREELREDVLELMIGLMMGLCVKMLLSCVTLPF